MSLTNRISVTRGGLYGGVFLAGAYILCILLDLLIPSVGMKVGWDLLLPPLGSLSPGTFPIGVVESFLIGALLAVAIAPIYNLYFFLRDKIEEIQARRFNDRLKYF